MFKKGIKVFVKGFKVNGIIKEIIVLNAKSEKKRIIEYFVMFNKKIPYCDSFMKSGYFVGNELKVIK